MSKLSQQVRLHLNKAESALQEMSDIYLTDIDNFKSLVHINELKTLADDIENAIDDIEEGETLDDACIDLLDLINNGIGELSICPDIEQLDDNYEQALGEDSPAKLKAKKVQNALKLMSLHQEVVTQLSYMAEIMSNMLDE